ncbi:hypothetical protein ABPG72_008162 [Tetrahymena utriculariae]
MSHQLKLNEILKQNPQKRKYLNSIQFQFFQKKSYLTFDSQTFLFDTTKFDVNTLKWIIYQLIESSPVKFNPELPIMKKHNLYLLVQLFKSINQVDSESFQLYLTQILDKMINYVLFNDEQQLECKELSSTISDLFGPTFTQFFQQKLQRIVGLMRLPNKNKRNPINIIYPEQQPKKIIIPPMIKIWYKNYQSKQDSSLQKLFELF